MPVFVDSNVFIYAAGRAHPLKKPCVALLRRIAQGNLDGTTSAEVIQEIHHVFRRQGRLDEGVALGKDVAQLVPDILPVTREDVLRSGDLLLGQPQLSPRDALHAATALNNGIDIVVSADAAFGRIEGITWREPGHV